MKTIPIITDHPFEGVFLDLDGVFADFEGRFFKLAGRQCHEVDRKQLWKIVNSDPQYFYNLELCKDAEVLWDYVKQYKPEFLTGLPARQGGKEQKQRWVAEKFGTEWPTHVVPKRDKQLYSGPNKILIDDTQVNIDQWISKGGHGVFHTGDVWETIEKVEELRTAYRAAA